ncbi:hypothetical protein J6590_082838 [Homalodisca vitripennis]|nr:hypothetical protein J6590_082838 [Homalodisca vitripennis]
MTLSQRAANEAHQSQVVKITETKNTILEAIRQINQFHNGIEKLEGRKLSSDFLSPMEFLKILQEVEKVVPTPAKLHLPVKLENMHEYYSVVIARSYVMEQTLRVVLQLPLKSDDKLFQVYNVYTYPIYDHTLKKWSQWDMTRQNFLVSKDRLQYTLYDETKFSKECLNGRLIVCPLEHVLMSVAKRSSCVSELFIGKMSSCCARKLITGLKSPVLLKTPNHWVYSTSEPHRVTLNCYESNGRINVTSLLMSGVGIITESYKCDVITDEFKVPARIYGSSTHVGQLGKMVIPELKSMFSDDETNLITVDVNATLEVLKGLDDELGSVGVREYPLEWALFHLRSHHDYRRRVQRMSVVAVIGTCIVLSLILLCVFYRHWTRLATWCQSSRLRIRERKAATLTSVLAMSEAAMSDVEMGGGAQTTDEMGTAAPEVTTAGEP